MVEKMIDSYIKYKDYYFEKYIKNQDIIKRIKQITSEIDDFYGNEEILYIGVLNGVLPFMNHILLNSSNKYSYRFLQVSSYSGTTPGKIHLQLGLNKEDLINKNVLLIEDIIDSGKTINYLKKYISSFSPKSFKVASLLVKSNNVELCDWHGFKISDKFVIGFGLDLDGSFRYLKDIYIKVNNVKKR
ncbi:MAG: hypoxanthine phosphoribosyltransferase [Candidatus Marinimicrobia bacterium]|nr:hypoxanthine phosphoribosyltransferase [Candidatus Neomarinimicrobiota bacterium]